MVRRSPAAAGSAPRSDETAATASAPEAAPQEQRDSAAAETVAALAPGLGVSHDNVTVHTGAEGDARANAHGSLAVTEGSDIFLSSSVTPDDADGRRIIAHEMAHVVQQSDASTGNGASGPRGDAFEQEADQIGEIVAAGGSASPKQRTDETLLQGFGGWEHKGMGDDVHSTLNQVVAESEQEPLSCGPDDLDWTGMSKTPTFGGISQAEREEQRGYEAEGHGASQSPGLGRVDDVQDTRVAVPRLAAMLEADREFIDRKRGLTVPLRNFKMQTDDAGAYLAIETDPTTREAVRYDVPVSPGDLTSLNGDLYGSMENLRKAPVSEFLAVQKIVDEETAWEQKVAAGIADPNADHDFNVQWEKATAWRAQPVFGAGRELGPEGAATDGDTKSYLGLAMENQAHFADDTAEKDAIEVQVQTSSLPELAAEPQGNYAGGNEQAWMRGHAKALVLAREGHDIQTAGGGELRPFRAPYGHEGAVPETGMEPGAGNAQLPAVPRDANGDELKRSSGLISYDSKLNDAYVENAGADHYLTDAFAAGHQIVRDVIGRVIMQFVQDKGGQDAFLDFIIDRLEEGAIADPSKLDGELADFRTMVRSPAVSPMGLVLRAAARGQSPLNGIKPGLKQKLQQEIDETKLRGIGAKVVHDYYNQRGVIVHNRKGMTFVTKGDTTAGQATEAQRIIALAVLESRTQIRECAETRVTPNMQDVWDYTPDFDKTAFTEANGVQAMDLMFSNSAYMWNLIKDSFKLKAVETEGLVKQEAAQEDSEENATERLIQGPPKPGHGSEEPVDVGTAPLRDWLQRRRKYISENG